MAVGIVMHPVRLDDVRLALLSLRTGHGLHEPPQSLAVSSPFRIPSVHPACLQMLFMQLAVSQSLLTRQRLPSAHGEQIPPHAVAVSPCAASGQLLKQDDGRASVKRVMPSDCLKVVLRQAK